LRVTVIGFFTSVIPTRVSMKLSVNFLLWQSPGVIIARLAISQVK